ncbi:MAG: hypothetical protein JWO86_4170 [Myxococcaceae bacterium]|nr:hypothetical protein [Myxococcaceae bacterium]
MTPSTCAAGSRPFGSGSSRDAMMKRGGLIYRLIVALAVALFACGKSRGDAECDRACVQAKADALDALDASETAQRAKDAEQKRRDESHLAEEWRLRQKIIRSTLADAKRLGPKSSAWLTYLKLARANLDRFRATELAKTPAWIELDALATSTQRELEALKPAKPRAEVPAEPASAMRDRYKCRTGAMIIQVYGWDPCLSPALEVCDLGDGEDKTLIDLATLGCARVGSDKATTDTKASIDVCCPPPP